MTADFRVLLDACVLANHGVCDLLLRFAELPRLYLPLWSDEILAEVRRTHLSRLKPPWPERLADFWQAEVRRNFPESIVEDHRHLISAMPNDAGDRHVLAAAIVGHAQLVVTFNLRHFPDEGLKPLGLSAVHPQDYLVTLFEMKPEVAISRLFESARHHSQEPLARLKRLAKSVPSFAEVAADAMDWDLRDAQ